MRWTGPEWGSSCTSASRLTSQSKSESTNRRVRSLELSLELSQLAWLSHHLEHLGKLGSKGSGCLGLMERVSQSQSMLEQWRLQWR